MSPSCSRALAFHLASEHLMNCVPRPPNVIAIRPGCIEGRSTLRRLGGLRSLAQRDRICRLPEQIERLPVPSARLPCNKIRSPACRMILGQSRSLRPRETRRMEAPHLRNVCPWSDRSPDRRSQSLPIGTFVFPNSFVSPSKHRGEAHFQVRRGLRLSAMAKCAARSPRN
jgi:hypothetical protein